MTYFLFYLLAIGDETLKREGKKEEKDHWTILEVDGVKDGEQVTVQQTEDGDQAKAMERKEHPILNHLDDPLHINGDPIRRPKIKNMKEALNGLIKDVKVKDN